MNFTVLVAGLPVLWLVALLWRDGFRLPLVAAPTMKFTHVLPAILQIILFSYWALYWPPVIEHMPLIGIQLLLAYAIDILLAWTLRRPYSPNFGPLPVVLSANLFVWFPDDFAYYAVAIAVALGSKALLRSGGRHIFNPSVFGLSVIGVLTIALPRVFRYADVSHDFDRPPHMALLILLLALIPQIRLRTAPLSVGAALAMIGMMLIVLSITGYHGAPSPWWPAWLLTITLLAGDPATIPTGSAARLLFGLFLGVAFYTVSRALLFTVETDTFSKIIPIPVANYLVPFFEREGQKLSTLWPALRRETVNRAYIALWVSMSLLVLIAGG
jgi:hypothetical protein